MEKLGMGDFLEGWMGIFRGVSLRELFLDLLIF